jgi:hypothetical protein
MSAPIFDNLAAPVAVVDCRGNEALVERWRKTGLTPGQRRLSSSVPDGKVFSLEELERLMNQTWGHREQSVLLCRSDFDQLPEQRALRAKWLRQAMRQSGPKGLDPAALAVRRPADLAVSPSDADGLQLATIGRMTEFPVQDSALAFVLGMTALPSVARRSWREGVTLLRLDSRGLCAALVYRDGLFSLLELGPNELWNPANPGALDIPALSEQLADFRLGWLPPETAARLGGYVCRVPDLPSEAEGFGPTYIGGENAKLVASIGQTLPWNTRLDFSGQSVPWNAWLECWGMLHVFYIAKR